MEAVYGGRGDWVFVDPAENVVFLFCFLITAGGAEAGKEQEKGEFFLFILSDFKVTCER